MLRERGVGGVAVVARDEGKSHPNHQSETRPWRDLASDEQVSVLNLPPPPQLFPNPTHIGTTSIRSHVSLTNSSHRLDAALKANFTLEVSDADTNTSLFHRPF